MQLLPGTAAQVSRWSRQPAPSTEDLYDPSINIPLGTEYLQWLMKRYRGHQYSTALAVASYNGGPENVRRWVAKNGEKEFDEFVEEIPIVGCGPRCVFVR